MLSIITCNRVTWKVLSRGMTFLLRNRRDRGVIRMTTADSSTSESLLIRVRDPDDSDAWRLFESVYGPLVESFCQRRGLQSADAADVRQNVILRLARTMRGFDYDIAKGRFRDWLGAITRNELRRFWAREQRQPVGRGGADADPDVIEVDTIDPEWQEQFAVYVVRVVCDRIRGEFEASTWQAFEATWFRQESPMDVATRLGLTLRAVYVAKSRVATRLRAEILVLAEDLPTLA
jgi:RNA polymerase sigma factor (sigma-70 family)